VTDRVPKGQKSIEFVDQIFDERRRKTITRRRIIEGSEKYGLPTATDDSVVLALIQLSKLKGNFRERAVEFTRLELLKMLGWTNEGKNYDRLKLSLLRITNVTYNYDNAWWDGRQKMWTTKAFHIIDTVEINDSRASGGQAGLFPSRIVWGDVVFDSFQAGFLRNIDFQLCMRLEHPIALRMYRFLGKRFYHNPDLTFELKEFAYVHLWLGRNYEGGSQIARKLQPAIEELESVGFLEPLSETERFQKKGREWSIRLLQKAAAPALAQDSGPAAIQHQQAAPPLVGELANRGVTATKAAELVRKHPAELIERQLDYFDWRTEKKPTKIDDPGAYLVDAIKRDYAAPKDFVCKAEQRKAQEANEANEREAAAERGRKQRREAADRAAKQIINAHWESLTLAEQQSIDARVMADAPLEERVGPMAKHFTFSRRWTHLKALLQAEGKIPID
jgi:hypothetical protein